METVGKCAWLFHSQFEADQKRRAGRKEHSVMSDNSTRPSKSNEEIAALLRKGDPLEFELFVYKHAASLTKMLVWRFPALDYADIEDIMQDTFLQIYNEGDKYNPAKATIGYWLGQKAYYKALTLMRERERQSALTSTHLDGMPDTNSEPVSDDNAESASLVMEQWFKRLPLKLARVMWLYYHDGIPASEIAQQLKIKEVTVRVHLYHGVKRLRQLLQSSEGNEQ